MNKIFLILFLKKILLYKYIRSVQFSCSVVSDSLRPHELQHTRPPCLTATPGSHPDYCPSSQWCWSFSFSINPSNEHPGLISFRMDSLDLLAVQGTLKSLLQHHTSKASILSCSAFFMVQLSHPFITTEKTIALTKGTFVGKVMSLLFNMLPRFVIAFLPRSKSFNFVAAVTIHSDFGAQENEIWQFPLFPDQLAMKWWDQLPWSFFFF